MQKPELELRIREAFPHLVDADFGYQSSDLFVVYSAEVQSWLAKNYEFYANVRTFRGQEGANWNGAGKLCLDIPFAGYFRK